MLTPIKDKDLSEICNLGSLWCQLNLTLGLGTEGVLIHIIGAHYTKVMDVKTVGWDSLRRAPRDA